MNNKIVNQISFEINYDFKRISTSLDELAKKIGHVTENYGSFGKMIVDCGKVFSNNIGAYQKASDGLLQYANNVDLALDRFSQFQVQLDGLKQSFSVFNGTAEGMDYVVMADSILSICVNLREFKIITKVASTAQSLFTGATVLGSRALYIYQMQMLTARAAIATTTGATKAMNIAIAASPYLIAAAAAATLGIAIYKLALGNSETAKAQKRLDEAMTDMNKEVSTEQNSLDTLFGSLYKAKEGTNEWKRAKDKIQEKYGDYLSQLGIEITNVDTARVAYSKLSTAILETARARASERALSSAGDALADKEGQNLTKMRQVLTEEYGEETGNRVFEGIAASIRRGDKEIPERWMQFVRKLNKTVVQSYGTAGQASSYVDNPITPYIYSMQSARKDYEKEVKRINAVLGSPLQKPDTNTITERPKSVFSSE